MLIRHTALMTIVMATLLSACQEKAPEPVPVPVKKAERRTVESPIGVDSTPTDIADLLDEAREFVRLGREAQAQSAWRQILRLDPIFFEALMGMAESLIREDRIKESESYFKRAIQANSKSLEARLALAGMYRDQDRYEEALAQSQAMIDFSRDPNVLVLHGTLLLELGRQDEAAPFLERALGQAPNRLDALTNLANTYADTDKLPEAEALFRKILVADSKSADTHYNLGTVLQTQKRYKEALASYKAALVHAPGHAQALAAAEDLTIYLRRR